MKLEVGKIYFTNNSRKIQIVDFDPNWGGGMYWGNSVDGLEPKINHERWLPNGKWWSYISQFSSSPTAGQILSNPDLDLDSEYKISKFRLISGIQKDSNDDLALTPFLFLVSVRTELSRVIGLGVSWGRTSCYLAIGRNIPLEFRKKIK